jgi:hypothetical protein
MFRACIAERAAEVNQLAAQFEKEFPGVDNIAAAVSESSSLILLGLGVIGALRNVRNRQRI